MKKPENLLEIYLTPGEFHFGDSETRVRTLLGEGGIFTLWHARRQIGCICHFHDIRRQWPTPQLDPAYVEEALGIALVEMSRQMTRPREYMAKLFIHDGDGADELLNACRHLFEFHGIPIKVDFVGRGNLVFDIWNGEVWMQRTSPSMAPSGKSPESIIEIYLHPGEWHFGDEDTRIKTLLGSCVAFSLWHPERRIGGMCHYMLPRRENRPGQEAMDGKYAEEALELLINEMRKEKTHPQEYVAKVFGGGNMLDLQGINISERNVEIARKLIKHYGFRQGGECLGGVGHRNVIFDVWSGEVWLKRGSEG
jgi:chemotaxis protein CheD